MARARRVLVDLGVGPGDRVAGYLPNCPEALVAFLATAGLGLAVLGPVTKAVVDRARPVVDSPVVEVPSNASFPSGHAVSVTVVALVLLVVAVPALPPAPWPAFALIEPA